MPHSLSRPLALAAACVAAPLVLVACGGGNNSSTTAPGTAATGSGAAVDVANNPDLGQILVDAKGRTLYLFEKDESDESYCNGSCASSWPPYTTNGEPQAGSGADASKLDTLTRDDGSTQVIYAGHPLYYYSGDKKPGDTNGNELDQFGAEWYALHPDGSNAEGSESGGGGSGGGGRGYSY